MTTIAQNLLLETRAKYRVNNQGKHPVEAFADLDDTIINSPSYKILEAKLTNLERSLEQQELQLDRDLLEAQQLLIYQTGVLNKISAMPTYTYDYIDPASIQALLDSINSLLSVSVSTLETLSNRVSIFFTYTNTILVILAAGTAPGSIPTKEGTRDYVESKNYIPTTDSNSGDILKTNALSEIIWGPAND